MTVPHEFLAFYFNTEVIVFLRLSYIENPIDASRFSIDKTKIEYPTPEPTMIMAKACISVEAFCF